MKRALAVIVALLVVACATVVVAQREGGAPGAPGAPGGPGGARGGVRGAGLGMTCPAMALTPPNVAMIERGEALQLTDDQKTKLTTLLTKSQEALAPIRKKAAEASAALRQAVLAPTYDAQKVAQLASDAQKTEVEIINAQIRTWTGIRSILTAQQVTALQQMLGRRMGPGPGRPGQPGAGAPPPPPPSQ